MRPDHRIKKILDEAVNRLGGIGVKKAILLAQDDLGSHAQSLSGGHFWLAGAAECVRVHCAVKAARFMEKGEYDAEILKEARESIAMAHPETGKEKA